MKRLKKAQHDIGNRSYAICFIDDQIYTGHTHNQIINDYLKMLKQNELHNIWTRPIIDKNLAEEYAKDYGEYYYVDDYEKITNTINKLAFGHVVEEDKAVYIEEISLQNVDLDTVAKYVKKIFPDYEIYNDDTYKGNYGEPKDYQKVAKTKRLIKKSRHSLTTRSEALCYIDGEIYDGYTHPQIINDYLKNRKEMAQKILDDYIERNKDDLLDIEIKMLNSEFQLRDKLPRAVTMQYSEFDRNDGKYVPLDNLPLAFAHIVNNENAIYIEQNSMQNVDLNMVANAIKQKYPSYNIYNDDSFKGEGGNPSDYEKVAKIKRLIKKSKHGLYNRDLAFCYIDGEIFTGRIHPDIIQEYLLKRKEIGKRVLNDYFKKHPNKYNEEEKNSIFDYFEKYDYIPSEITMQYSEYNRYGGIYISIDDLPLAFGHIVYNDKAIYVENDSLQNIEMDIVVQCIKDKYPEYNVYNDDSYNQIGGSPGNYEKVAKLIKKSQYVHCHNCGWDNGDFIESDNGELMSWVKNKREKTIKKIKEEQEYNSYKEYKEKNPEGICPKCNKKQLDID